MVGTRRLKTLEERVTALLETPDLPLVVALSGGADSAALGHVLASGTRPVRAVHVDHGLPGSPLLRSAAEEIAGCIGIDLEVVETVVGSGPSPEAQARSARYAAFAAAVKPNEALLTAHTVEDNAETVIMNLARGAGIRGLAGIPRFRPPNIYRPALRVPRALLREVAVLAGLPFRDDPMNLDPSLTRNRVRAFVMPRLRELNPSFDDSVSKAAELLSADADLLEAMTPLVEVRGDVARLPLGTLKAMSEPVRGRLLRSVLGRLVEDGRVDHDLMARVGSVLGGETRGQDLASGVTVEADGAFLVIRRDPPDAAPASGLELVPGRHRHRGLVFDVLAIDGVCRVAPLGPWHAVFPSGTELAVDVRGVVLADGEPAWEPGVRRLPVAWYRPGDLGYLSVFAREEGGWTLGP